MNDVRLDPWQVPARAEVLLAAELGEDAPGRLICARPEPDDHDDGERTVRIKVGAVRTRCLHAAEATETASGVAYGKLLRGRPERAPCVPVGSALLAWTDALDAHSWRAYRATPAGTVMYDEWIDDDPANGGLALTRPRAAADEARRRRCAARLPGAPYHAAARRRATWPRGSPTSRPGASARRSPARGPHGAGGAENLARRRSRA